MGKNFDIALKFLGVDKASPVFKEMEKKLDAFSKKAQKIGESLKNVGGKMTTSLTLPLIAYGTYALKSFADQEKANARLVHALKITNKESEINVNNLYSLAESLQKVTRFEDDATVSMMGLLQQMANLNEQQLKDITPAIQDFAEAMGMDLASAGKVVAKTIATDTNMLARYGIHIQEGLEGTDRFNAVLEALNSKFKGTSVAMGKTTEGRIIRLKNAFSDMSEKFGEVLLPYLIKLVDMLTKLIQKFDKLSPSTRKIIVAIAALVALAGPVLSMTGTVIQLSGAIAGLGATKAALALVSKGLAAIGISAGVALAAVAALAASLLLIHSIEKNRPEAYRKAEKIMDKEHTASRKQFYKTNKGGMSSDDRNRVRKEIAEELKQEDWWQGTLWELEEWTEDFSWDIMQAWDKMVKGISDGIRNIADKIKSVISEVWKSVGDWISGVFDFWTEKINGFLDKIGAGVDKIKNFFTGGNKKNNPPQTQKKSDYNFDLGSLNQKNSTDVTIRVKSDDGTTSKIENVDSKGNNTKVENDTGIFRRRK